MFTRSLASRQDRCGFDLDEQVGLTQRGHADQSDRLQLIDVCASGGAEPAVAERCHLVRRPVDDVDVQLRNVGERAAGGLDGDCHVSERLLGLGGKVTDADRLTIGIAGHLAGDEDEARAGELARREPITLRSLVAGTGTSTMAVYTYFDGMPGLWGAVRQEGFRRLAERTRSVTEGKDPVRHLAALGVAYVNNALANPDLQRVMFDARFDLPDPASADDTFGHLIAAAHRAIDIGRFAPSQDPADIALRL